jgi:hypothetical protein
MTARNKYIGPGGTAKYSRVSQIDRNTWLTTSSAAGRLSPPGLGEPDRLRVAVVEQADDMVRGDAVERRRPRRPALARVIAAAIAVDVPDPGALRAARGLTGGAIPQRPVPVPEVHATAATGPGLEPRARGDVMAEATATTPASVSDVPGRV